MSTFLPSVRLCSRSGEREEGELTDDMPVWLINTSPRRTQVKRATIMVIPKEAALEPGVILYP